MRVEVAAGGLDVGLCVNSGQVFRWQTLGDSWSGYDGATSYSVCHDLGAVQERATGTADRQIGHSQTPIWRSAVPVADRFVVETNGTLEQFKRYFRLDWDAGAIQAEILKNGPELEPHMRELRGLRLLRPACTVEAFFGFLCTPNNNLKRIKGMVHHLASHSQDGGFPGTEIIANLEEPSLRAKAFGYRAATIPEVARQVRDRGGDDYIESLKSESYEEAHQELLSIKGIGPKLADCICLFALDHTEAVPVDTHIWQAATRLFYPEWKGESLTAKRYQAIGDKLRDRFGKLAGWAQQYLFYENLLNWRTRSAGPPSPAGSQRSRSRVAG